MNLWDSNLNPNWSLITILRIYFQIFDFQNQEPRNSSFFFFFPFLPSRFASHHGSRTDDPSRIRTYHPSPGHSCSFRVIYFVHLLCTQKVRTSTYTARAKVREGHHLRPIPPGGVLTDKWFTGMLKGFEVHFRKFWYIDGWVIVTYPMRLICKIGCNLENLAKKHPICLKLSAFCRKMV